MIPPNISPELQSSRKYDEIVEWFEKNGWKEGRVLSHEVHNREWYSRYPGEPYCKANQPKPIQLVARLFDYRNRGADHIGIDVQLTAEPTEGGGWVAFTAYGFSEVEEVPQQVERLLKAWRAIAKN